MTASLLTKTNILRSFFIFLLHKITTLHPLLQAQKIPREMHPKMELILDTITDYYHEAILNEVILQNFYELNRSDYTEIPEIGFEADNEDLDLHLELENLAVTGKFKLWNPEAVSSFLKDKKIHIAMQFFSMSANSDLSLTSGKLTRTISKEIAAIQEKRGSNPYNWTLNERKTLLNHFDKLMILFWYKHFNGTINAKNISKTGKKLSIFMLCALPVIYGFSTQVIVETTAITAGFTYISSHFIPSMVFKLLQWNKIRQLKSAFVNHHFPQTLSSNQIKNQSILSELGKEVLEPRGNKLQSPIQSKTKGCRSAFSLSRFLRNNY